MFYYFIYHLSSALGNEKQKKKKKKFLINSSKKSRTQLFKTNHDVSKCTIKTFIIKYGIYANIFAEKNLVECFLDFFSAKYLWL